MTRDGAISASLRVQARVIDALLHREILTRYGRHNIGALWLIAEPMLFTLGIAALWHVTKLHTLSAIPVIAFAVTGYSCVLVWRNAANRSLRSLKVNADLMFHRNVRAFDIFFSRCLLEVVGGTWSFVLLTLIFSAFGAIEAPHDMLALLGGWFLLCWFAFALAFCIASLGEYSETCERLWHVSAYLLFPLSGAVFMVHWLPPAVRGTVLLLPMVHGVELVRHGFFGDVVPTYENVGYLMGCNMVLTLAGLALARSLEGRVPSE